MIVTFAHAKVKRDKSIWFAANTSYFCL